MQWRRWAAILGLALWVLGGSDPASASLFRRGGRSSDERELRAIERLVQQADERFSAGERDPALALYGEALRRYTTVQDRDPDSENAMVRFRMAYCEHQIGLLRSEEWALAGAAQDLPDAEDAEDAERAADAASAEPRPVDTAADPETTQDEAFDAEDLRRMGTRVHRLRMTGRVAEARELLQLGLRRAPQLKTLHLLLATVMIEEAEYEDAMMVLSAMPAAFQTGEAYALLLGAAQYGLGKPFDSMVTLDRALVARPDSAQAYMNLARLRFQMAPETNAHEAEAYYRFAVRLGAARDPRFESRVGIRWDQP